QFSVADDPAFAKEPFVRAEDLQVNMKLLPFFRKEIEVSKVILHQPVINIIKDQQGQFNFSTIGGQKEKQEADEEKKKKEQGEKRKPPPALLVSLIDVENGQIQYTDRSHFSGSLGKDVLPQINGALNLAGVSARIAQLPQPISDVNAKINFTGKTAELPE